MLGGYAVGVLVPRPDTQKHSELERYLRLEYGGRMNLAAFLARQAQDSQQVRTNGWKRIKRRFRAFASVFRSIAARRSEAPIGEV